MCRGEREGVVMCVSNPTEESDTIVPIVFFGLIGMEPRNPPTTKKRKMAVNPLPQSIQFTTNGRRIIRCSLSVNFT